MPTDGTRELICHKWIDHGAVNAVATGAATTLAASNVASIGTFGGTNNARTRFVEFGNQGSNVVLVTIGNSTTAPAAATTGGRVVPPNSFRIFPVPQGGQGIVSCIALGATTNVSVSWGVGRV